MSDDLIKRSDVVGAIINHCENECYYRGDNWCPQCQREEFQEAIEAVPSADKPQGEWIYNSALYALGNPHYDCNCCGESVEEQTKFCPNCGAKMKGANDETNY